MLGKVDLEKRNSLKKKIVACVGIGIGLLGLSNFVGASSVFWRTEDGDLIDLKDRSDYVVGDGTKKITVSSSTPSSPSSGDLWVDTS
jgi:hypothetical protein